LDIIIGIDKHADEIIIKLRASCLTNSKHVGIEVTLMTELSFVLWLQIYENVSLSNTEASICHFHWFPIS